MKKKLLTVALAATMVMGSVFSAFAETKSEVTIDAGFVNDTGVESLEGDFDITYTFKNKTSDPAKNWNNFILEFFLKEGVTSGTTGKGFLTLRADAAGWWAEGWGNDGGQTTTAPKFTNADGSDIVFVPDTDPDWIATMGDADVTINATRKGETIKVTYKIVGANGKEYNFVTENTNVYGFGKSIDVRVTGEKVELSNVKFVKNAVTPAPVTPEPTTPVADKDKKPAPVTGDSTTSMITLLAVAAVGASLVVFVSKKSKVTE